jgi:hypothetical protein
MRGSTGGARASSAVDRDGSLPRTSPAAGVSSPFVECSNGIRCSTPTVSNPPSISPEVTDSVSAAGHAVMVEGSVDEHVTDHRVAE